MLTNVCRETIQSCQNKTITPSGSQATPDSLTSLSIPNSIKSLDELERWVFKHFPEKHYFRKLIDMKDWAVYDAGYAEGFNDCENC